MHPTPYPAVNQLLATLLARLQALLGEKLLALYLYGSLVTGDFDPASSDVDLLAALAGELTADEFAALDRMHAELAAAFTEWSGRLEIAYLTRAALQTFKTQSSPIAIISPGEPFHFKTAGRDWLINWYVVREKGVALFGPEPQTLIAPITRAEFNAANRELAGEWHDYVEHTRHSRPYQGYAILTLCRALYAHEQGEQVSKLKAATWAAGKLPEWAALIEQALAWRADWRNEAVDHAASYPAAAAFVRAISTRITTSKGAEQTS